MKYKLYDIKGTKPQANSFAVELRKEGYCVSVRKIKKGYGVYVGGFRK